MSEWVNPLFEFNIVPLKELRDKALKEAWELNGVNCRIGKSYPKQTCTKGTPCQPVEGHFITECGKCDKY